MCSMYDLLASHPALSVEPVRNAESKVHPRPVESGPDVFSKAPGSLCTCFERNLVCAGLLDDTVVWFSSFCSSLLPAYQEAVIGWASGRPSSPSCADFSPGQWQVGGWLCCPILGLETKERWYPFRNTQGETESPPFLWVFSHWEGSEKILSAFWNLEGRRCEWSLIWLLLTTLDHSLY